jgi:hypothetical protein
LGLLEQRFLVEIAVELEAFAIRSLQDHSGFFQLVEAIADRAVELVELLDILPGAMAKLPNGMSRSSAIKRWTLARI